MNSDNYVCKFCSKDFKSIEDIQHHVFEEHLHGNGKEDETDKHVENPRSSSKIEISDENISNYDGNHEDNLKTLDQDLSENERQNSESDEEGNDKENESKTPSDLETSKDNEQKFPCNSCGQDFTYFNGLKMHQEVYCPVLQRQKEKGSPKKFKISTVKKLLGRKEIKKAKKFICDFCNRNFSGSNALNLHKEKFCSEVKLEEEIDESLSSLDIVNAQEFSNFEEVNTQEETLKFDEEIEKKDEQTPNSDEIEKNSEGIDNSQKDLPILNKSDTREENLIKSPEKEEILKPCACLICEVWFIRSSDLQLHHELEHSNPNEEPMEQIDIKDEPMEDNDTKDEPMEDDNPCKCDICHVWFANKPDLNFHIQNKHPPQIIMPQTEENVVKGIFSCQFCLRTCKNDEKRLRHENFDCRKNSDAYRNKPKVFQNEDEYQCLECPNIYKFWKDFVSHVEKVHCSQPKKCLNCGEMFKNQFHFNDHIRNSFCGGHVKTVKNSCRKCGKRFQSKLRLKKHEKFMCTGIPDEEDTDFRP